MWRNEMMIMPEKRDMRMGNEGQFRMEREREKQRRELRGGVRKGGKPRIRNEEWERRGKFRGKERKESDKEEVRGRREGKV